MVKIRTESSNSNTFKWTFSISRHLQNTHFSIPVNDRKYRKDRKPITSNRSPRVKDLQRSDSSRHDIAKKTVRIHGADAGVRGAVRAILNSFQIRKSYLDKYFNGAAWSHLIPCRLAAREKGEKARRKPPGPSWGQRREIYSLHAHTRVRSSSACCTWSIWMVRRCQRSQENSSFFFARWGNQPAKHTDGDDAVPVKLIRMNKFSAPRHWHTPLLRSRRTVFETNCYSLCFFSSHLCVRGVSGNKEFRWCQW